MAYACVRTDNMSGTTIGKDLVSLKYFDGEDKEAAIENGSVVLVGAYLDGQREVRKATAVAKNSKLSEVALIAHEEVDKTKAHNTLKEYINIAGLNVRGYRLPSKDCFSLTKEAFTADSVLAKDSVVELAAGTKFKAVASATDGSTTVGKIVAVEGEWYVVEVE